ncbi:geraniol 8-hydroxylase [Dorcoceras hygrometricum]|uniref:Geraniol 8-hydroxylase n=1 Tax=Dorcoceras hygrometricum TaxID=472368 RepID=A0A2Z7BYZ9_9LAMI|nr:geraniol 8-hydroxylase [Dorcoceras hygrometricum]
MKETLLGPIPEWKLNHWHTRFISGKLRNDMRTPLCQKGRLLSPWIAIPVGELGQLTPALRPKRSADFQRLESHDPIPIISFERPCYRSRIRISATMAFSEAGRARSSFKGRIKEHLLVVVNTENMNSLSTLDHRKMEKLLPLVRPPMRVHQLISRSDIGHKKYNLNMSPASSGFSSFTADPSPDA